MEIRSYPKIYHLGHREVRSLFDDEVIIEEKVDGSSFSFGKYNGELFCRSKGQQLVVDAPEKMFERAVETAKALLPLLKEGWTYRGEYLQKPKHNTLAYDRIPNQYIMIYDIDTGMEEYLSYSEKWTEANRLGLETVPLLFKGKVSEAAELVKMLDTVSVLGGQKIEGFVIKNYLKLGSDKKVLMAKHVSEAFKEVHRKDWKETNPGPLDLIVQVSSQYNTPARWRKAVQHLRERGELTDSPKDIGALMKEIPKDIREECEEEIKELLFQYAWPKISRAVVRGFPEFYKNELMKKQFEGATNEVLDGIDRSHRLGQDELLPNSEGSSENLPGRPG